MWESIGNVLISSNGLVIIVLVAVLIWAFIRMGKKGLLKVHTKYVSMGADDRERTIIREQCDWVHTYVMGLITEIEKVGGGNDKMLHGGFFTRYILELCYDEFVRWITFNHITTDEAYVKAKQDKVAAMVLSNGPRDEFRTPEFRAMMDGWVETIIKQCVQLRNIYAKR